MSEYIFRPERLFFGGGVARIAALPLLAISISMVIGCAGDPASPGEPLRPAGQGRGAERERAALVGGALVERSDLWPLLAERAGAAALEAWALDRAVRELADRQGVGVDEADLRAERRRVERAIAGAGLGERSVRGRALAEARARRGWGPAWFDALLRRNALARKLTADRVQPVDEAGVRRLHERLHGPRRVVRVIVTPSEREVARLRGEVALLLGGEGPDRFERARARFMTHAIEHSEDVSSARGGLLDPVGRWDEVYPDAFRDAVFAADAGGLTPVVALDEGFAVALVESERPASGVALEDVRGELADRLRLDMEQRAMAALLDRLRAEMRVEPLDAGLRWSWAQRYGAGG